jgi:hypothetical protein
MPLLSVPKRHVTKCLDFFHPYTHTQIRATPEWKKLGHFYALLVFGLLELESGIRHFCRIWLLSILKRHTHTDPRWAWTIMPRQFACPLRVPKSGISQMWKMCLAKFFTYVKFRSLILLKAMQNADTFWCCLDMCVDEYSRVETSSWGRERGLPIYNI